MRAEFDHHWEHTGMLIGDVFIVVSGPEVTVNNIELSSETGEKRTDIPFKVPSCPAHDDTF